MRSARGIVAAGHSETANAAAEILREGGNAFDAIVAAHFMACVAEPVLSSLAGGGFLLGHRVGDKPRLYDFFVQTPRQNRPDSELDFYPVVADFGTAQQEFHIGLGAVATPGCVSGLFRVHRDLCTMPMSRLVEPAIALAKEGLPLDDFQAYIFSIVQIIYLTTPEARRVFANPDAQDTIVGAGQRLRQAELADTLENLAREGEDLFYRGEIAASMAQLSKQGGGFITRSDLENYQVILRKPLSIPYRNAQVFINPPPSSGGLLIAFALDLLAQVEVPGFSFGSPSHLRILADAMQLTQHARVANLAEEGSQPDAHQFLNPEFLSYYRAQIAGRAQSYRGTTHVSIIDAKSNVASMTVSNGEGCGHIIPGTGIMLNNMLGEEDINPGGFHRWPTNQRMTSMMAPGLVILSDGTRVTLGSGGSNRIRSALLQVLSNLIDFEMSVEYAVNAPRIHLEGEHLSIEDGFPQESVLALQSAHRAHTVWPSQNLFFGGAHTVTSNGKDYSGAGDPRRGGTALVVR